MELVIERPTGGQPVAHLTPTSDDDLTALEDALALARAASDTLEVWLHGSNDERDELLRSIGYSSDRTLLQLRRPLPAPASSLPTRPFAEADLEELVEVNNRAFAWHPEQSGHTTASIREQMEETWFDPDGLRIFEREGRIAGFCWTKIHREPEMVGEIFVIGLDPDFAGQGLGGPLTSAGLDWLAGAGCPVAMLYVESDNTPARIVYERLGFVISRTDRLWRRVQA